MNFQADKIYCGDAFETLKTFPDESVNCCITSPPYYGLRDYGVDGQIGNETTPEEYIYNLIKVFDEIKRILKKDGTLWLNIGDSYAGSNQGKSAENIRLRSKMHFMIFSGQWTGLTGIYLFEKSRKGVIP